jgi:DMSO/TMAO reductase YedYZ molybdopterin-dependent catalytic subunit
MDEEREKPGDAEAFNESLIRGKMRRADLGRKAGKGVLAGGRFPDEVLGTGEPNRHGMPKLPPGQHAVKNWPVLDLGVQPAIPKDVWTLSVQGQVEHPLALDWAAFMALPQVEDVSDFHCVTSWSRMDNAWGGVRFRDAVAKAVPKPTATHVYMKAYDGYTVNLPLAECMDDDVLLVHTWEGIPLPREHGGPVRMITPRKWAWKGAKWIKEIHLLPQDMLGYWELRGYSNTAEPWADDRYSA